MSQTTEIGSSRRGARPPRRPKPNSTKPQLDGIDRFLQACAAFAQPLDLEQHLALALESAREALALDRLQVWALSPKADRLIYVASSGLSVFKAIWVDSLNMNDPATVAETLTRAGFDAQALVALASEQTTKDALKAATQTAVERGVFGAPTFFVGDQMFWGQDRMDFVQQALLTA